jgi:hypothetical protein
MKVKEPLLPIYEVTNINRLGQVDAYTQQGWMVSHRRDDEPVVVFKADEASIEEVVDAWREQQTVFTIESLLVSGITPGLGVAGDKMDRIIDAGDATAGFDLGNSFFEQALSFCARE